MKPEAQCIAIAEACGFATHKRQDGLIEWRWPSSVLIGRYPQGQCPSIVPNYTMDLNAMHEAEKVLTYEQFDDYYIELAKRMVRPFHATAAQRAEAFLRALNLWRDDA